MQTPPTPGPPKSPPGPCVAWPEPPGKLLSPPSTCGPHQVLATSGGLQTPLLPGQSTPSSPSCWPQEQRSPPRPLCPHCYLRWLQQQTPWTAWLVGKALGSACLREVRCHHQGGLNSSRWLLSDLKYLRCGAEPADQWPRRQRPCWAAGGSVPTWTPSRPTPKDPCSSVLRTQVLGSV